MFRMLPDLMKLAKRNNKESMERQGKSKLTAFRHPLNVIVETFGNESARVCGELSKQSLRDLLMPSLTFVRKLPITEAGVHEKLAEKMQGEIYEKDSDGDKLSESHFTKTELSLSARLDRLRKLKEQREKKKGRIVGSDKGKEEYTYVDRKTTPFHNYYNQRADRRLLQARSRQSEYDEQSLTETRRSSISCLSSDWESALLSHDKKWLRRNIAHPLRLALREIVIEKPNDPVSYLSFWLLNYKKSQEFAARNCQNDNRFQIKRAFLVKESDCRC